MGGREDTADLRVVDCPNLGISWSRSWLAVSYWSLDAVINSRLYAHCAQLVWYVLLYVLPTTLSSFKQRSCDSQGRQATQTCETLPSLAQHEILRCSSSSSSKQIVYRYHGATRFPRCVYETSEASFAAQRGIARSHTVRDQESSHHTGRHPRIMDPVSYNKKHDPVPEEGARFDAGAAPSAGVDDETGDVKPGEYEQPVMSYQSYQSLQRKTMRWNVVKS
ncbi:hypothetical protein BJ166DRAFT_162884 [Pestalotiopsis sp. NC0098]|nr:hypothetical protein BJ166DRAFT_162884 [Pestalotiopsis sp. NC0098]